MATLKVSQIKSGIGGKQNQRNTLRTLGLRRVGDVSLKEDRPEVRGMLATVSHLVSFEELSTKELSTKELSTKELSTKELSTEEPGTVEEGQ